MVAFFFNFQVLISHESPFHSGKKGGKGHSLYCTIRVFFARKWYPFVAGGILKELEFHELKYRKGTGKLSFRYIKRDF